MELSALVGRAREGDVAYAVGLVRDFALAEDVAQEAFMAAWASLPKLETPAAFPGWLRGIVGHCAHRVLRRRVLALAPLDEGSEVAAGAADPAVSAERREVTLLHYVHERSHEQIATFLGLPATTVNNRLHAARAQLKRRMLAMVKDTLHEHRLPEDFPARLGRIVSADGPLVEARFETAEPPEVYSALALKSGAGALHVIQRLPDGRVRGLAAPGLRAGVGARVVGTDDAVTHPLDDATLARAIRTLRRPPSSPPALLETAIKVLDLLCPLAAGGAVAVLGDMRVGATVVVEELALRLKEAPGGLTMFEFLPPGTVHPTAWPADRAEGYSGGTAGTVQTFFFLRERLEPGASMPALDAVDAVIVLTPAMREMEIYPCVNPLATRSRLLDPAVVGAEHAAVARRVRDALTTLAALEARGEAAWSEDERRRAGRARKLRQFFGQPFYIAEPYTKRPGTTVTRADTVRACAAILDGGWDQVPEAAFRFAGGMDEVLVRGRSSGGCD